MKLLKKALISVLSLAVCLAVFATGAFAMEADEVADVLKYYESPEYLMEDFSDAESAVMPSYNKDFEEVTVSVTDGALKIVNSAVQGNATAVRYSVELAPDQIGYGVNLDVKSSLGVLTVRLQGQGVTEQALHLLFIDFDKGAVVYRGFSEEEQDYVDTTVSDFTLASDEWTSVRFFYNSTDKTFSFKVGPKDGELASVADISFPLLESVSNIIFGFEVNDYDQSGEAENVGITAYVDNVEVYSSDAMYTAAEKQLLVTAKVKELKALYAEADDELKARIVDIIDTLVNVYGYSTDDLEAKEFVDNLLPGISVAYLNVFLDAVSAIDKDSNYQQRLAQLGVIAAAKANIRSEDEFTDEQVSAYADAIVLYEAEVAEVDAIAASCENFMASLKAEGEYIDITSLNYAKILTYTNVAAEYAYDISYEGVSDALAVYESALATLETLKADAIKYYNAVCILANDEGDKTLGERYLAYLDANTVKDIVDFSYTDENITGELLNACPTKYTVGYGEIEALVIKCQDFMTKIDQAGLVASYYTKAAFIYGQEATEDSKKVVGAREILATFTDGVEETYPDMDKYLETYYATVEYLETSMTNKNLYVDAVNELEALWDSLTYSERVEKVNAALELKAAGTVPGLSIIVENTKLDNYKTVIDTLKMHSDNLINIVNVKLKKSGITLLERRQLIAEAQYAAANSEPTYTGVYDAKVALKAAISLYNSDVANANSAYKNNLDVAVSATGGVSLSSVLIAVVEVLKRIIAFIFG